MANDLQLALVGVGVVLVGGVWAYNKWQERGHRQRAEKVFGGQQEDVLMGTPEPARPVPEEPLRDGSLRREPTLAQQEPVQQSAPPREPGQTREVSAPPASLVDEIADCILRIEFVDPVAAPALWAAQAAWADRLLKPMRWLGYDETAQLWKQMTAHDAGRYAHVLAALQLADRNGACSEAEIAAFLEGVHRLVQQFSGLVDMPQAQEVLAHAQSLDQFCAGVDMQLGVSVMEAGGAAMPGTKLRGLAEAAGYELAGDGSFHAKDENGSTLFVLGNAGTELFSAESLRTLSITGLTFTLDVPRVAAGTVVFDRMISSARQFAQGLNGRLVDAAHKRPLDEAMLAGIRTRIDEIQQRMRANQIVPGSVRALRLFS